MRITEVQDQIIGGLDVFATMLISSPSLSLCARCRWVGDEAFDPRTLFSLLAPSLGQHMQGFNALGLAGRADVIKTALMCIS